MKTGLRIKFAYFFLVKNCYVIINDILRKVFHVGIIATPRSCEHDYKTVAVDWVRASTLQGIAQETAKNNVVGITAELGVYQGFFARLINYFFPNRELYLFDTFEGFGDRDARIDREKGYSNGTQDFSDTSVDYVRSRMKYPQNCLFVKGLFPDTTKNIEEKNYCFVSIDADLYAPIKAGLEYFYPRLSNGGYIMVHDFDNTEYPGARQAVMEYCKEHSIGYTRIPDVRGSAIINKSL